MEVSQLKQTHKNEVTQLHDNLKQFKINSEKQMTKLQTEVQLSDKNKEKLNSELMEQLS